jgi:hypothetical protein
MATRIPFSANDLKNKDTKAEYVGLDREDALRSVLRCHVATKTVWKTKSYIYAVDLQNKYR